MENKEALICSLSLSPKISKHSSPKPERRTLPIKPKILKLDLVIFVSLAGFVLYFFVRRRFGVELLGYEWISSRWPLPLSISSCVACLRGIRWSKRLLKDKTVDWGFRSGGADLWLLFWALSGCAALWRFKKWGFLMCLPRGVGERWAWFPVFLCTPSNLVLFAEFGLYEIISYF